MTRSDRPTERGSGQDNDKVSVRPSDKNSPVLNGSVYSPVMASKVKLNKLVLKAIGRQRQDLYRSNTSSALIDDLSLTTEDVVLATAQTKAAKVFAEPFNRFLFPLLSRTMNT